MTCSRQAVDDLTALELLVHVVVVSCYQALFLATLVLAVFFISVSK